MKFLSKTLLLILFLFQTAQAIEVIDILGGKANELAVAVIPFSSDDTDNEKNPSKCLRPATTPKSCKLHLFIYTRENKWSDSSKVMEFYLSYKGSRQFSDKFSKINKI